jgi:nucleotide-binding universal stress UspA family protein
MSYATVMVHVDLDSPSEARTRLSLKFADQFDSTLIGAAAIGIPPVAIEGAEAAAQIIDEEYDAVRSRLARAENAFRRIASGSKKLAEWRSDIQFPTDFLRQEANAADLIVVGRERTSASLYYSLDPGALILNAGRPILAVPKTVESIDARSVVVAWKDTREARRALQDCLPFLHEAENVFIVEVTEKDNESPEQGLSGVSHYLTRHRIKATTRIIGCSGGTPATALLSFSKEHEAGLLVAGAYGHSRLGEWMFGGVTRELLQTCPICCLLSH